MNAAGMTTLELNELGVGLMPLSTLEMLSVDGGDTGYYGSGANLDLLAERLHAIGDFFSGVWDGMTQ
jgi:hypothetical protein